MVAVFGINSDGLNLAVNMLILFLVVIYLALVYWTYMDAIRRIEDPMLVICATVASLFPFVGTILYVIVRPPEYLEDIHERELEIRAAQARLHELDVHECPHCGYEVERAFLRCPSCTRKLRDPCQSCGKPLDPTWKLCPYCEAEIPGKTPRRRRRREPAAEPTAAAARRRGRPSDLVPGSSASQYGQIFHAGSSGRPQLPQGSRSLRRHVGQRRKSFSTS